MANILQDKAISRDLQKHFLSIVKIALQYLKFHKAIEKHFNLDYVFHLKTVFKQDCIWLDLGNYIPAIINSTEFNILVQESNIKKHLLKLFYTEPLRLPI